MPTLALPPWLRAANPAPYYGQGMQIGLAAARQQAAAMEAQQRMALEAERMALNNEIARQEMAIRESQLGLSAEELSLNQMVQQAKIDQATRQYEAQQEYQRRIQAGEDPVNLLLELGPMMGGQQTAEAAILRAQLKSEKDVKQPEIFDLGEGIKGVWNPQSGAFQMLHERPELTDYQRDMLIDRKQTKLDKLYESNPDLAITTPDEKWTTRRRAAWDAGRKSVDTLEKQIDALESFGQGEPAAPGAQRPVLRFDSQGRAIGGGTVGTGTAGAPFASPTYPSGTTAAAGAPPWPATEEPGDLTAPAPRRAAAAPRATVSGWLTRYGIPAIERAREAGLPESLEEAKAQAGVLAGSALKTNIGKGLADIGEAVAAVADLPTLNKWELMQRVKELRDYVESLAEVPD